MSEAPAWYFRAGVDPWQMCACETHAAAIAALGFRRGIHPRFVGMGDPPACAFCSGSLTIDQVRACRCNDLGVPCPIHRPEAAGVAGEWVRVRCEKCQAPIQLPADRVAFDEDDRAVDVTGWARRNGDGDALRCPFHGAAVYYLGRDDSAGDQPQPSTVYGPPLTLPAPEDTPAGGAAREPRERRARPRG